MPTTTDICRLRMLVGFLGEKGQANWWPSAFLAGTSSQFLTPVFGASTMNARLVGVTEAARRVHDAAIGVGQAFHLFRLPETVEQEVHRMLSESSDLELVSSTDEALQSLEALAPAATDPRSGPVHVGTLSALTGRKWIPQVAAHYRAAFAGEVRRYPYFAG